MKKSITIVLIVGLAAAATALYASEPVDPLEQAAAEILRAYYANATFVRDERFADIHMFAVGLRDFTVYRLNKVGNWQQPREVYAPDRGGISIKYSIRAGRWKGASLSPANTENDLYIFKETHVIKNSAKGDCHIWAEILTPRVDPPNKTKNQLIKLFTDFEHYYSCSG